MNTRKSGKSQETAAAKASISERSGRRIEKGERLSIPGERHWRTREDPLEAIWKKELVPLLGSVDVSKRINQWVIAMPLINAGIQMIGCYSWLVTNVNPCRNYD